MEELRKVEVFRDEEWKEIKFEELQVGDKYRMFESEGVPVVGKGMEFEGTTEWIVTKNPYYHNKGRVLEVGCVVAGVGVQWDEVTKEEIYNAMLMPGEYVEKDGKLYVKRGMLDGYIDYSLLEEYNDKFIPIVDKD